MQAVIAARAHIFPNVHQARLERFNRNQKADGPAPKLPHYPIGTSVYLSFPKGRFRPVGGSTKFSDVNKGPYSILEIKPGGLVYTVQHIDSAFISNVSVTRMIPAAPGLDTTTAVDFPEPWRQLHPEREDRRSDRTVPSPAEEDPEPQEPRVKRTAQQKPENLRKPQLKPTLGHPATDEKHDDQLHDTAAATRLPSAPPVQTSDAIRRTSPARPTPSDIPPVIGRAKQKRKPHKKERPENKDEQDEDLKWQEDPDVTEWLQPVTKQRLPGYRSRSQAHSTPTS